MTFSVRIGKNNRRMTCQATSADRRPPSLIMSYWGPSKTSLRLYEVSRDIQGPYLLEMATYQRTNYLSGLRLIATSCRQKGYTQYKLQIEPGCWAQEAVGCRKESTVTSKNFPISDQSPRSVILGEHRCICNISSIFRFFDHHSMLG
jgi:hypothetical protein